MSKQIGEVNDTNFAQTVLESDQPVLVDFWAEWCGPCRALAPTLEAVASDWSERGRVVKLNIDESPVVTQRYGIRAIPTLILFKDGEEAERLLGSVSKSEIERKIEHHSVASAN
ncbi:MAG TPA: thioredoxin [Candidatus Binatus sp.]|nr:thioredoxin [Candidatus Binatus sp.]